MIHESFLSPVCRDSPLTGAMITTDLPTETQATDLELVARSRDGDRDAFADIVARYQTLVCSLTFSICGNVHQSEEIAQETFVTAWRRLSNLQEPGKLKSWLCGIARNLAHNAVRRQRHVPTALAESLDEDVPVSSTTPRDEATARDEAAILWKALKDLPESYREPMVLFYREGESVRAVAQCLDLSEDAVKQRLARGRVMLAERVERALRSALHDTAPGSAFTLGVLAALPLLATSAKAAVAGATVAKGGSVAKSATAMSGVFAVLGSIIGLGAYVGHRMSRDAEESAPRRKLVVGFWRALVLGIAVFVLPVLCLWFVGGTFLRTHPQFQHATTWWLGLFYVAVALVFSVWLWRRRTGAGADSVDKVIGRCSLMVWVVLAMTTMGALFAWGLSDSIWKTERLTPLELQRIITERKDAQIFISQYQNGSKWVCVKLPEKGRHFRFEAPVDDAVLAVLKGTGITCPTYVQGRDFEVLGAPGRWIGVLAIFVLAAGTIILLRRSGKSWVSN